ncbi:hypothetical protein MNBD_ALPHA05-2152 [hydrothermal vent metagenome]|uniref:Uncharacterized protein n=1 Tax=hydrothermal vent metagenome TaxID=652676 RepID=A0A3B0RVE1_9ZZZZ
MDLSSLSQIAEIIAAIAVVVTFIFVGLEVRANTRATRSSAAHDAMSGMREFFMLLGANEQASIVWFRGITDPEALSPEETLQFFALIHSAFLAFQSSYSMTAEGTLDPELRDSITSSVAAVKDLPGFKKYWAERKDFFKAGFREYIDDIIMRGRTLENQTLYQNTKPGN